MFWMHFNKTGHVDAVKIVESTKHQELDDVTVNTFYHWRCRAGAVDQVIVSVTFTLSRNVFARERNPYH